MSESHRSKADFAGDDIVVAGEHFHSNAVVIQGGDRGEAPLRYEKHSEHYNS